MYALDDTVRFETADPAQAARANVAAYQAICSDPFDGPACAALLAGFDQYLATTQSGAARRERA
jgi:hypothetical protein